MFQLICSGCTGVMLVLASCVLVAPLLAIIVAMACVGCAWMLLRLDPLPQGRRRLDGGAGDGRQLRAPEREGTRP